MTLFWTWQAFRFCHLSAWMGPWNGRRYITGCFTKRTLSINFWIFITSCDDPGMFDEQYTAPAWNGLISARTASAPPCTYTVGVLYLSFVCLRRFCSLPTQNGSLSKSSAAPLLSMSSNNIYGTQKTPKKLLKKTWKQCRDGGWLTEVPVLLWWWAWILTQIDTGSPFPRGESPPRPEILPLWIIPPGRTKRQFCSDLWNDQHHISPMLLADRHHWLVPSPKDQSNPCVPTRKENSSLLRYLILYSLSCRLVPMEIRDTSSTRY